VSNLCIEKKNFRGDTARQFKSFFDLFCHAQKSDSLNLYIYYDIENALSTLKALESAFLNNSRG
jgi:hypothetical protein